LVEHADLRFQHEHQLQQVFAPARRPRFQRPAPYDNLNRLSQAYTSGTNWGETFTIDPWGNLTNKGPVSGKTNYENFNAAPASIKNQLSGYSYDAAGNLLSDGLGHSFTYDAENRIIATGGFTYVYDGDGKRVKKCAGNACTTTGTLYWTVSAPILCVRAI